MSKCKDCPIDKAVLGVLLFAWLCFITILKVNYWLAKTLFKYRKLPFQILKSHKWPDKWIV